MSNTAAYYLTDLGTLLKERALAAKAQAAAETGPEDHQFARGRLFGYYEVLSLMRNQAIAFGLSFEEISLENFDPDRELLSVTAKVDD